MASDTLIRNNQNNSNNTHRVSSIGSVKTNSDQRSLTGSLIEKFENESKNPISSTVPSLSSSSTSSVNNNSTISSNIKEKIMSPRKRAIARSKEENNKTQSKNPFKNILKKSSKTPSTTSTTKYNQPRSTSSSSLKNLWNGNSSKSTTKSNLTHLNSTPNLANSKISEANSSKQSTTQQQLLETAAAKSKRITSGKVTQVPIDSHESSHKQVLFQTEKAKILEYGGSSEKISTTPGSLLGIGSFEVYKIQKEESVAYIHCGSVIYPLLSKSKIIRVGFNIFILPLSNPERYWKITVDTKDVDVITGLSLQFQKISDFYSVYVDSQEELEVVEDKEEKEAVPLEAEYKELNEDELVPYQQLLQEAELRKKKSQSDRLSIVMKPTSEDELDPFTSELTFNIRRQKQQQKGKKKNPLLARETMKKSTSDTSITSTVACFSLNDYEEEPNAGFENDETKVNNSTEDENKEDIINGALSNNEMPKLQHPIPVRPSSVGSSLDSVLDKFDVSPCSSPDVSQSNMNTTNEGTIVSTIIGTSASTQIYPSYAMNLTITSPTVENSPQITADSLFLNEEDSWMDPDEEVDLKSLTQEDSKDRISITSMGLNSNSGESNYRKTHSSSSSMKNVGSIGGGLYIQRQRIISQDSGINPNTGLQPRSSSRAKQRISSFDISRRYSLTFKDASYNTGNSSTLLTHPPKDLKEILRSSSLATTTTTTTTTKDSTTDFSNSGGSLTTSSNSLLEARGSTDTGSPYTKYGSYNFLPTKIQHNTKNGTNTDLEFNLNCFEEEQDETPVTTTVPAVDLKEGKSTFNITNILGW